MRANKDQEKWSGSWSGSEEMKVKVACELWNLKPNKGLHFNILLLIIFFYNMQQTLDPWKQTLTKWIKIHQPQSTNMTFDHFA